MIRLLGEHALTSPGLTGDWERRLALIETGGDSREAFMGDIVKFTEDTVGELDRNLKDVRIPRANLGPCPVCGHDIVENRKGYSCWSREDPGCGFVIWKSKAGKQLAGVGGPRADQDRADREAGAPGSRDARARASAPGSRCSRPRTASGASSSTSRGRRRAPSRPRPRRPRRRPRSPISPRRRSVRLPSGVFSIASELRAPGTAKSPRLPRAPPWGTCPSRSYSDPPTPPRPARCWARSPPRRPGARSWSSRPRPTPTTTPASWPQGGAVLGSVLTFSGLAFEIAARAGYAARRLTKLQRERVLERALAAPTSRAPRRGHHQAGSRPRRGS